MKLNKALFLSIFISSIAASCSKSSDDPVPVVKTPKLGTTWTYQMDKYGVNSNTFTTSTVKHKATSELNIGGETWLRITDDTLGLVYILNTKTGGLYQYDNSVSNLLCKYPATVNDSYNTYNYGAAETFTVKETGLSLGSSNGASFYNVNRYEGVKSGMITDQIWYNNEVWFARRETWIPSGVIPGSFRRVRWILQSVTYL